MRSDSRYQVFISYARVDREAADRLWQRLSERWSVYLDRAEITGGDDWVRSIRAALEQVRVVIVLVTPRVEGADGVRQEVAMALERAKRAPERCAVVPIWYGCPPRADVYGLWELGLKQGQEIAEGAPFDPVVKCVERVFCAGVRLREPERHELERVAGLLREICASPGGHARLSERLTHGAIPVPRPLPAPHDSWLPFLRRLFFDHPPVLRPLLEAAFPLHPDPDSFRPFVLKEHR